MAALIYLDTHVLAWLYAGRVDLFPEAATERLNRSELLVSPMAVLELEYLFEVGRISEPAASILDALGAELGVRECDLPFAAVVRRALSQSWTREPFDRVIVAQAAARDAPLLTRDESILDNYPKAVWDR